MTINIFHIIIIINGHSIIHIPGIFLHKNRPRKEAGPLQDGRQRRAARFGLGQGGVTPVRGETWGVLTMEK